MDVVGIQVFRTHDLCMGTVSNLHLQREPRPNRARRPLSAGPCRTRSIVKVNTPCDREDCELAAVDSIVLVCMPTLLNSASSLPTRPTSLTSRYIIFNNCILRGWRNTPQHIFLLNVFAERCCSMFCGLTHSLLYEHVWFPSFVL